jgi:Tfp pilus assembly protein PilV
MFIKLKNKKRKGFSIGEVLLAIFVLSIGMIAVFSLFNAGIKNLQNERDLIVASLLAQEGVEVVRNIRDNNWADRVYPTSIMTPLTFENVYPTNTNESKRKNCFISYDLDQVDPSNCNSGNSMASIKKLSLDSNGFYGKFPSGTETKFRRKTSFVLDPSGNKLEVTSMVLWGNILPSNIDACTIGNKCVFSQSVLTNWGTGT